jgi:acetamidase/formamidase
MVGQFASGIEIPLRPFFGSMGVAPPPDSGRVSSNPPGRHAGNLDNKELVAGTTLFIPVHAKGALFEIGDGHAAQGDGEVDQTAIETSLRGRLQLVLRKDLRLAWPRGETPTHFIAMGMDPDLTKATQIAVQEAVDLVAGYKGWSQMEAYRFVSVACDVHVTQLVDGSVGVHVMIPKPILGPGRG